MEGNPILLGIFHFPLLLPLENNKKHTDGIQGGFQTHKKGYGETGRKEESTFNLPPMETSKNTFGLDIFASGFVV